MLDHLGDWYGGDIDAARLAHAQHAEEGTRPSPADACDDPDCGPDGHTLYMGDLEAARRAHAEHHEST